MKFPVSGRMIQKYPDMRIAVIVVLEGFDESADEAAAELGLLIQKFCSAKTKSFIVDKETTEIEW